MPIVKEIDAEILNEIKKSILSKDYGSVEIYIEHGEVVQITERTIKKTASNLRSHQAGSIRAFSGTLKR